MSRRTRTGEHEQADTCAHSPGANIGPRQLSGLRAKPFWIAHTIETVLPIPSSVGAALSIHRGCKQGHGLSC